MNGGNRINQRDFGGGFSGNGGRGSGAKENLIRIK